ncbi:hypothetical protein AAG570_013717 [Ranatra chinensis]|uniref:CID domain-containing protein n=1 Tax=Ranatra chinensis TaxID=642074 RepID=A0ABD0YRR5_9HEMI
MAGFTESALFKKLEDLNESQQSIQTLSLWLIHHRKHYQLIVNTWAKELLRGDELRKLTLMYLANDVIQNSKKKGPEYTKQFASILKKAFKLIGQANCGEKTKKRLERMLAIWEERTVYEKKQIEEFRKLLNKKKSKLSTGSRESSGGSTVTHQRHHQHSVSTTPPPILDKSNRISEVEVDGAKELHVTLSPYSPAGDPPEPEELIRALIDLENAASVDVAVREKISKLPPEVSEVKLLSKLEDKETALKLAERVNAAVELLTDYNNRLVHEMEERKKITQMLKDYMHMQKELLSQAESRIEEYKDKLIKVEQVRHEVLSHLSNLPDLKQLPDVTGGLAPLPSAGDLFT